MERHQHIKRDSFRIHVNRMGGTEREPLFRILDRNTKKSIAAVKLSELKELVIEAQGEIAGHNLASEFRTPKRYAWIDPETLKAHSVMFPHIEDANEFVVSGATLAFTENGGDSWVLVEE